MRVIIQPDYEQVSKWAANYVAASMLAFRPSAKKPFVLGLPTGSLPVGTYNELAKLCEKGKLSFKNVVTFNMDEYVALPEDHPESYHSFMWRNLFSQLHLGRVGHTDSIRRSGRFLCGLERRRLQRNRRLHVYP